MNSIELGKFLANLRIEKKLTQEELAERLFIDKRKVSRWECGMCIPDFETLIKLSEILDVSLYELSICKRLDKEKLSRKAINKFKSVKDFKKYKLRKKLKIILAILLGIVFLFTLIYTIKFYGTVEIYEFKSLDDVYTLEGAYVKTENYSLYSINAIYLKDVGENFSQELDNCEFKIYSNQYRISNVVKFNNKINNSNKKNNDNRIISFNVDNDSEQIINDNSEFRLEILCENNEKIKNDYLIKFEFVKKYSNKLF